MTFTKLLLILVLALPVMGCKETNNVNYTESLKTLSEKSGIEMIVIDEAQKITHTNATRLVRSLRGISVIDDPIRPKINQEFPKNKTVGLPGISFLVDYNKAEVLVDALNKRLSYRNCLAFISDDSFREDKKQTISIIISADKYNILRLQETAGGSYIFSTDSLILRLQELEIKYPFDFVGVGPDWCLLKFKNEPKDYLDFAKLLNKVCPLDENGDVDINSYAQGIKNDFKKGNRNASMWWD